MCKLGYMPHAHRPFLIVAVAFVCLACASGPIAERAPKDIRQGIKQFNKSSAYYNKGCYPKALEHIQEAFERFSVADQLQGTADSLDTMANIYYRLGDYQSALIFYDETIELFKQLKLNVGLVKALTNKSATLTAVGRLDEASLVLDQADKIANKQGLLHGLRLKARAILLMARKDYKGAEGLLADALRNTPESDQSLLAGIYYTFGDLMLTTQRPQQAVADLNKALEIDHAAGAYFSVATDLATLGACYERMAKYAEAAAFYKRSVKIFALLEARARVEGVLPRLETSADKSGMDLQATLYWVEQWVSGHKEAGLCR